MTDHQYRAFGVDIFKNSHPQMRRLRRELGTPAIHGNKLWHSSLMLMDYLGECGLAPGSRVLELGCGYGIAGIYCAKQFGAEVTLLDADAAVLPYAQFHAEQNEVEVRLCHSRYEQVRVADFAEFDLVIGGDICFWDEMSSTLFNMLRRCQRAQSCSVLLADPGRPPFRDMAERAEQKLGAELFAWHVNHPWNLSGLLLTL